MNYVTKESPNPLPEKAYARKLAVVDVEPGFDSAKIGDSMDAADYAKKFFFEDIEIFESFFILCLDIGNHVKSWAKISQGGVSGTVVDMKIIAKYAIDSLCPHVIVMHNHPSGTLRPSNADNNITRKIKEGLKLLDITLLDHIILTKESYYSYADNGGL